MNPSPRYISTLLTILTITFGIATPAVAVHQNREAKVVQSTQVLTSVNAGVSKKKTNQKGKARMTRKISRATKGWTAKIHMTAKYKGVSKTTVTGFTPR